MITIDFEDLTLLREALRDLHVVGRDRADRLMALYERVASLPLQRDVSFDIRPTSDRASIVAFLHTKADKLEDSIARCSGMVVEWTTPGRPAHGPFLGSDSISR